MNYVILIIAGVCGMVVGSYLGKKQRIKKARALKKLDPTVNPQIINEQVAEKKVEKQ